MLLEANYPENQSVFGASPNERARQVLMLIEDVLRHESESRPANDHPARIFSSENGIVAALFLLAMKCSDENVCHRAFGLLSTSQRREDFYDAENMAAIVGSLLTAKQDKAVEDAELLPGHAKTAALETVFNVNAYGGMDSIANSLSGGLPQNSNPSC
jgi:hypothetical protein